MLTRIGIVVALVGASVIPADAQRTPSPDSLVAYWLKSGAVANWSPAQLYIGCPDLLAWQRRGIDLVLSASLSAERTRDLAIAWMGTVGSCPDPRLEQWYFAHLDDGMRRGADEGELSPFWHALQQGDSPAIRLYLRRVMLDGTLLPEHRDAAGAALFVRFDGKARLREYLSAFETGLMPEQVAVGQSTLLLELDADQLLREVGERVRRDVRLADQTAFLQVAQSSYRYASQPARKGLADALEDGLRQPGLNSTQRMQLDAHVRLLRRPLT